MTQHNPYTKSHATAAQRIAHLRSKGLVIARPNVAARRIEQIGYERLRIYFLSRRNPMLPGKPFEPGTTYTDILKIHDCDLKLRDVCFREVGQFELMFRNRISEVLSTQFGSHPYFDATAFASAKHHNEALQKVIQTFMQSKDERARHYRRTYTEPPLPPIWMFKEFLTFGAAARFYSSLANPVRSRIASSFGVPSLAVFDSWVPCFVDLRNICAHHDRLFNKRFQKQPQRLRQSSMPSAPSATLKAQLECLEFVLRHAGAASDVVETVQRILDRHACIRNAEAGY